MEEIDDVSVVIFEERLQAASTHLNRSPARMLLQTVSRGKLHPSPAVSEVEKKKLPNMCARATSVARLPRIGGNYDNE